MQKKRLMQKLLADAKAKADAKVAEEKRIKDQLAADAKKAKAALAVEKAPAIRPKANTSLRAAPRTNAA
jgi:hypothetical protein